MLVTGCQIWVWDDSWLPGYGSHLVPMPIEFSNTSLRVFHLICFETGKWNELMLIDNFVADERRVI